MHQSLAPMNDEFEKLIASMPEEKRMLVLIPLIMYASEHPEILTESLRKYVEDFANSTASIIEED